MHGHILPWSSQELKINLTLMTNFQASYHFLQKKHAHAKSGTCSKARLLWKIILHSHALGSLCNVNFHIWHVLQGSMCTRCQHSGQNLLLCKMRASVDQTCVVVFQSQCHTRYEARTALPLKWTATFVLSDLLDHVKLLFPFSGSNTSSQITVEWHFGTQTWAGVRIGPLLLRYSNKVVQLSLC